MNTEEIIYVKLLIDYVKQKFKELRNKYGSTAECWEEMKQLNIIDMEESTSIGRLRQYRQHKFETKQAWAHIKKIEDDVIYNELLSYRVNRRDEKKTAIIQSIIFFPLGIFLLTKSVPVFFDPWGDGWLVKAWAIFLAFLGVSIGVGCFSVPWTTYEESKNMNYEDLKVLNGHIYFPDEHMNKNMYPPDFKK